MGAITGILLPPRTPFVRAAFSEKQYVKPSGSLRREVESGSRCGVRGLPGLGDSVAEAFYGQA